MSESPQTYAGTVYPHQCDHMGHMNVMWYVGKFDEASWRLFALLGITRIFLDEARRGMAAVQQKIAYRREVYAGDTLVVRSTVIEVRDKALRFVHEMSDGTSGEVAAVTELTAVQIDSDTRRAVPLPEAIRARAEAMRSDYDTIGLWR